MRGLRPRFSVDCVAVSSLPPPEAAEEQSDCGRPSGLWTCWGLGGQGGGGVPADAGAAGRVRASVLSPENAVCRRPNVQKKYLYICNVCCKTRKKKRLCLLKKILQRKKPQAVCAGFSLWGSGEDSGSPSCLADGVGLGVRGHHVDLVWRERE